MRTVAREYSEYTLVESEQNEVKLLRKDRNFDEGFSVEEVAEIDPSIKSFTDDTRKIVFDNSAPYGHLTTSWVYVLLIELERLDGPATILFTERPDTRYMRVEHSSNLTEYLEERFTEKGHTVKYIDADEFYVSNFISFTVPIRNNSANMGIVADFFSEGLDYSKPPTKKIYLSRAKTTTRKGNKKYRIRNAQELLKDELTSLRNNNIYQFSDRIDDEEALEEYLKTLGFTIFCAEDNDSYRDQLQLFASSKIVMSITSSGLSLCSVMSPNTLVVELVSPMDALGNRNQDAPTFQDIYKNISTLKANLYLGISNRHGKAENIIRSIESNPALKTLLSS